ncbi:hypothetical protein FQN52_006988 [Onygenales sp. PD_12]|nr:hypothetical protein FQN52_006988 [Onygenales sp. PD_12]
MVITLDNVVSGPSTTRAETQFFDNMLDPAYLASGEPCLQIQARRRKTTRKALSVMSRNHGLPSCISCRNLRPMRTPWRAFSITASMSAAKPPPRPPNLKLPPAKPLLRPPRQATPNAPTPRSRMRLQTDPHVAIMASMAKKSSKARRAEPSWDSLVEQHTKKMEAAKLEAARNAFKWQNIIESMWTSIIRELETQEDTNYDERIRRLDAEDAAHEAAAAKETREIETVSLESEPPPVEPEFTISMPPTPVQPATSEAPKTPELRTATPLLSHHIAEIQSRVSHSELTILNGSTKLLEFSAFLAERRRVYISSERAANLRRRLNSIEKSVRARRRLYLENQQLVKSVTDGCFRILSDLMEIHMNIKSYNQANVTVFEDYGVPLFNTHEGIRSGAHYYRIHLKHRLLSSAYSEVSEAWNLGKPSLTLVATPRATAKADKFHLYLSQRYHPETCEFYHFYLSKPRSSIYWRQWEVLAPFYLVQQHYGDIRTSVSILRAMFDKHRKSFRENRDINGLENGPNYSRSIEFLMWWSKKAQTELDNFTVSYETFVETNWVSLEKHEKWAKQDINLMPCKFASDSDEVYLEKFKRWLLAQQRRYPFKDDPTAPDLKLGFSTPAPLAQTLPSDPPTTAPKLVVNKTGSKRPGGKNNDRKKETPKPKIPLKPKIPPKPVSVGQARPHPRIMTTQAVQATRSTPATPATPEITRRKKKSKPNISSKLHTKAGKVNSEQPALPTKYWSYDLNKSPEGKNILIHYCTSLHTTEQVAKLFLSESVIGLDLEWKAQASSRDGLTQKVSVIQLASRERIALFHLALFNPAKTVTHLVSPTLKQILESSDITKVGVHIKADCTRLYKYLDIKTANFFELSHLHKSVKYHLNPELINKRTVNLAVQVEEHIGMPLDKNPDIRCGDWTRKLNYRQVQYAATDPYACLYLYHLLEEKRLKLQPIPPKPAHLDVVPPAIVAATAAAEVEPLVEDENGAAEGDDASVSSTSEIKTSANEEQTI